MANLNVYEINQSLGIHVLGVGGEEAKLARSLTIYSKLSKRDRFNEQLYNRQHCMVRNFGGNAKKYREQTIQKL